MKQYFLSTRAFWAFAALVALVLVGAGCGSSGDGESIETGSLSKAQFIKSADAICEKSLKKVQLAGGSYIASIETSGEPYAAQQREAPKLIETVLVPEFEKQIEEVGSLGVPTGDEKEVARVLETMRQALDKAREEPVTFLQTVNPFAKAERTGKAYGFLKCGGMGYN